MSKTKLATRNRSTRFSGKQIVDAYRRIPLPVVLLSHDGEVLDANDAFGLIVGADAPEILGQNFFDGFVQSERRESARKRLAESFQTGNPALPRRVVLVSAHGKPVSTSWACTTVTDKKGIAVGALCVGHDTSEREQSEARQAHLVSAIERVAQEWTQTFDAVQMPVVLVTKTGRVRRLNRAAAELAHLSNLQDAIGRQIDSVGQGQPWHKASELAEVVAGTRYPACGQVRDGSNGRVWSVDASLLTTEGPTSDYIILVAHDITRLVELQDLLRRSETMSALGRLVVAVAHEIRNPLFIISATIDTIESEVSPIYADFAEYAGVLRRQKDRLSRMLDELLAYGRPMALERVPLHMKDLLDQAIEACIPMAIVGRVTIEPTIPAHTPRCLGDQMRLVQVFQNVIENAVQLAPIESVVRVEAEPISLDDRPWIECRIMDSGPGFREKDMSRLFEPFFTRRRNGTGLGLSLVQRIVEQHGGEIFARNRIEGGALMTIRLPAEIQHP